MKKLSIIFVFLLSFYCSNKLSADDYMLPDIASPGMNIYFEIIADGNLGFNVYGNDGIFFDNSIVEFRFKTGSESYQKYVKFGPKIVSWNGRMIASQLFVKPDIVPYPNTSDPITTNSKFDLEVYLNGTLKSTFTISIVQPFQFPASHPASEKIFGAGSLGKRSKRGAMIVDSVVLNNNDYNVSSIDVDASTIGNEAYLPFILISKGKVRGTGINSRISVDATAYNGGIGGGGGGGMFCDNAGLGTAGGDGFTGGGPGGRNAPAILGGNARNTPGKGTGSNNANPIFGGYSINSVMGGNLTNAYESAAGGTGHPFGQSGEGCGNGSDCKTNGKYGAGSGREQKEAGGGGGYAEDGKSTPVAGANNGGKKHGNNMAVPLAGGSGGASGNPQAPTLGVACSGYGGGGGGAIRISATEISNIKLSAKGADGGTGSPAGGGGSGGLIDASTKLTLTASEMNVNGGASPGNTSGGAGRMRWDANQSPTIATLNGSVYRGVTIDTTNWIKSKIVNLRGTCDPNPAINTNLYVRSDINSVWQKIGPVAKDAAGNWTQTIDLKPFNDIFHYVVAIQDVPGAKSGTFDDEPDGIMSQAAANILRVDLFADIDGDKIFKDTILACDGASLIDSITVKSTGTDSLQLNIAESWQTKGFKILSPALGSQKFPSDSTFKIVFSYTPPKGSPNIVYDSLVLNNNVKDASKNPWKVFFEIKVDTLGLAFNKITGNQNGKVFSFGNTCISSTDSIDIQITNSSTIPTTITPFTSNPDFTASIIGSNLLDLTNPTNKTTLRVHYKNSGIGANTKVSSFIYFKHKDCPEFKDSIQVNVDLIEGKLSWVLPIDSNFYDVRIGLNITNSIKLRNDSKDVAVIRTIPTITAPFSFVSSNPPIPCVLKSNEILTINVQYSPSKVDNYDSLKINLLSDSLCPTNAALWLKGNGINTAIDYIASYDFGLRSKCNPTKDSLIAIINNIKSPSSFKIIAPLIDLSGDAAYFSVAQTPVDQQIIKPGDTAKYYVRFNPALGVPGPKKAFLNVHTDDPSTPLIQIALEGFVDSLRVRSTSYSLDWGTIALNQESSIKTVTLTNFGVIDKSLKTILNPGIKVSPNIAKLIANNGTGNFDITITPSKTGVYLDSAVFEFDCKERIVIILNALVANGGVEITPNILDFGKYTPCEGKGDPVEFKILKVKDTSLVDINLDTLYITGKNASMFRFKSPLKKGKITPNFEITNDVEFVNPQGLRGYFEADITIKTTENGLPITYNLKVNAEVKSGIIVKPNPLNFGKVVRNASKKLSIEIEKDEAWQIKLAYAPVLLNNPEFIKDISNVGNDIPTIGTKMNFDVTFKPTTIGVKNDTLLLIFTIKNSICFDTVKVPIFGESVPGSKVKIWAPNIEVDPSDEKLNIPIYAQIYDGLEQLDSFAISTINFIYDQTVYHFKGFAPESKGKILNSYSNAFNFDRTITLSSDYKKLTKSDSTLVLSLEGIPLLGEKEISYLILDSAKLEPLDFIEKDTLISGQIKVKVCRTGDTLRLIKAKNPIKLNAFYSNNSTLNIEANVIEKGFHKLILISSDGRVVMEQEFENIPELANEHVFRLYLPELAQGAYNLVLQTPVRVKSTNVLIVR